MKMMDNPSESKKRRLWRSWSKALAGQGDWTLPTARLCSRFVTFLNQLEKQVPAGMDVHLIMDTYCTQKSAEVQRWLQPKKRQRFHFHFTPPCTSANMAVDRNSSVSWHSIHAIR